MVDVPRSLPKTDWERQRIIDDRIAGGSNRGASRWARPVDPFVAPASTLSAADGGPIGALQQIDTTSRTSTSFFLDPSSASFTFGDVSTMSYVSSSDPSNPDPGEPGILITETDQRWYYVSAEIDVSGTPANPIRLQINSPEGYGLGSSYLAPGLTGSQSLTASAFIYFDGGFSTGLIAASVVNPGGATIASGNVTVVKLS